jgi:hypothetical protein
MGCSFFFILTGGNAILAKDLKKQHSSGHNHIVSIQNPLARQIAGKTQLQLLPSSLRNQISKKRPQPGEPVAGIHIILDYIKRKVIKPAKTPNRNRQQSCNPPTWAFKNQQRR